MGGKTQRTRKVSPLLFPKLEALDETITKGQTGFYFRQGIGEAVDRSIQYKSFLKERFEGVILYMEDE